MGAAYGIDELRRRFALAFFGEWRRSRDGRRAGQLMLWNLGGI
jgi:hypothetical protein